MPLSTHVCACSEPPSDSDDDEQRGGHGDGEMDIWQRGGRDTVRDDAGHAGDGAPAHGAGVAGATILGQREHTAPCCSPVV